MVYFSGNGMLYSGGKLSRVNDALIGKWYGDNEGIWERDRGLSEAFLFIPKGSFHLLLLITFVLVTTRRDLVLATERGPCLVRAVHSL
jgi:hypothetical protein